MGEPEGGGTRSGRTFPHHWIEEERETSSILEDAHPRHAHLGEERGGIVHRDLKVRGEKGER